MMKRTITDNFDIVDCGKRDGTKKPYKIKHQISNDVVATTENAVVKVSAEYSEENNKTVETAEKATVFTVWLHT